MTATAISPAARLLRGFAIDFLTAHNPSASVDWVMDPAYRLSIGGHVFDGRDGSYLPATVAQLDQFPGLCVTVHDVILSDDAVAMRFTEHGASVRDGGRRAAWGGITLFRIENGRLRMGWAEEDYFARKRQLKSGQCDAIRAPHQGPWDEPVLPPDPHTERVVRDWLSRPAAMLDAGNEAICSGGPEFSALIAPETLTVSTLFTAGARAAFHAVCEGTYAGGFDDIDPALVGQQVCLPMAGMATLGADGAVIHVQTSADRLGLHRALLNTARAREA